MMVAFRISLNILGNPKIYLDASLGDNYDNTARSSD